jgi:hypothetical protein
MTTTSKIADLNREESKTLKYPAAQRESHAIVMGGSIARLLAARVLTDHFDQVTLIELDLFPPGASACK